MRVSGRSYVAVFSIIVFALLVAVAPASAVGERAEVSNIRCIADGNEVRYTFTLEVWGMRGREMRVAIFPHYSSTGSLIRHAGSRQRYRTPDGYVTVQEVQSPSYDSAIWDSFTLSIPASEFPSASSGSSYSFYPEIEIQLEATGGAIDQFEFPSCTVSLSSRSSSPDGVSQYARPTYGTTYLTSGFWPDPYLHSQTIISGGSIAASTVGVGCAGTIASAPDAVLEYSRVGSGFLRIYFRSTGDTTLLVQAPNGSIYCDDDSGPGLDGAVTLNSARGGTYRIWVGSYGTINSAGNLYFTELSIYGTY